MSKLVAQLYFLYVASIIYRSGSCTRWFCYFIALLTIIKQSSLLTHEVKQFGACHTGSNRFQHKGLK